MAAALIGEAFLSASVQTLCDKIGSGEFMELFRGKKLDHSLMDKLKMTLLTLHAVLNDAEEKQIVNPAVGVWLDDVKHAVLDAEELLDEIDTEALRCKVEAEYETKKTTQVWNFFSTYVNPFYQGMNGRIREIFEKLEDLVKQKDLLGLREGVGGKVSLRTPTTYVIEHEFCSYGRDGDKEELKTLLLSDGANGSKLSVIPIVGMGGVGKTTLAQLLYNDEKVKEHFEIKAWACVSEDFDLLRVTKTLVQSITSKPCDMVDMSLLQVELRERVSGKKFFVVLDDLWNDDYNAWDLLRVPFTYGARGSKVIVTTRNKRVGSIVHTVPIHYLQQLSHDDCWLLLEKHAFRNENPNAHPQLQEIGKKIARKCNGLPLAAKTLGGLLSCNMEYKEWSVILNSNLWELPHDNSILPSLRLSYHYLPSYSKKCFAYCSIFPKDCQVEKEDVIRLWMAEGLIPQAQSEKMEEVGEKCFDELVSRSLLQRSRIGKSSFTMHDLINDLAMFVSKQFCFRLDEGEPHEVPERVRHLSYMRGACDTAPKFQPLDGVNSLRTFLPMPLKLYPGEYISSKVLDDLLPAQKCLRVLSLSGYRNITRLPNCIGSNIHLRYIDFSFTRIKQVPDAVCTLYNLQTLLMLDCFSLTELPAQMRKLINLRHLDIIRTEIKEMPVQMGRLKSLRTLTTFVVGKSTGCGIGELGELMHLRGKLSILNLDNVVDGKDALRANLKDKKDLKELELAWGQEDADDSLKERDVLDMLQPPINLEKLTIKFYGGTSFPNWLGDSSFSSIQVIRLSGCSNCWSLPPVGQLPALKVLYIDSMKFITGIGPEFYGGNDGSSVFQPFRSLEKLEFYDMPKWEEWLPSSSGGECSDFPCLRELSLRRCPKLRRKLPNHLPSLKRLSVDDCEVLQDDKVIECLRQSVEDLYINRCPGVLSLLDMGVVCNSNRLQILDLWNCGPLMSIPRNALATTLTSLRLIHCPRLEFLSHEMMAKLTSLKSLRLIDSCRSLRCFPLGIFPKLATLYIKNCMNLESFSIPSEEGVDENLSHLHSLRISRCRNLVTFPHGGLPAPNLDFLEVNGCKNLKLLPDRIHTLTALRNLLISGLPNLESFALEGLPPNLQTFTIERCDILRPSGEWGLQGLVPIRRIRIWGSEDLLGTLLKEQLLPSTLRTLNISGMKNLRSLDGKGFQHLTSLQQLFIRSCNSLKFLPQEGLQHLTSLKKLEIHDCASLELLPEEGNFLKSLSFLSITQCCSLKKRYQNKTGEDWSKIAHIPCIEIDDDVII